MSNSVAPSPTAVIFGCAGETLTTEEWDFFTAVNPLGFILFARNCKSKEQVKALVVALRACVGRADAPVLIDQEGGRVARLGPPLWRKAPPAGVFAALALQNMDTAKDAVYLNARLIAADLTELGIDVDCAPLADVPAPGSHDIIGDRAFGNNPKRVGILAGEMARGLLDGGVLPVLKHLPGHGRAFADSHEELPVVEATHAELSATDFVPFRDLCDLPFGMTAHVLYSALDERECATLSPRVIRIIREEIGFDGFLMSDDISMKALQGDFKTRTRMALAAGCDAVLHCNGKMEEMREVAEVAGALTDISAQRLAMALSLRRKPSPFDYAAAAAKVEKLLKAAA